MEKKQQDKENFDRKDADFRKMCAWIEKELFGYNEDQKLQTMACLKLQGLRKGKAVANNNMEDNGNYSVEVVFNTFKVNKQKILRALKGKKFNLEANKMGYICAIVRNNINDVYTRMKNAKINQEKRESAALNKHPKNNTDPVEYKRQTEDIPNSDKFEEIW